MLHFDGFPQNSPHDLYAHQVIAVSLSALPQVPRLNPHGHCPFSTLCACVCACDKGPGGKGGMMEIKCVCVCACRPVHFKSQSKAASVIMMYET